MIQNLIHIERVDNATDMPREQVCVIQLTSGVYKGFVSNLFNTKDLITKKGLEPGQDNASRGIFSISNHSFSEINLVGYAINNNSYTWRLPSIDEDSHFLQEPGLAPDNVHDVKATGSQKAETVCYVTQVFCGHSDVRRILKPLS